MIGLPPCEAVKVLSKTVLAPVGRPASGAAHRGFSMTCGAVDHSSGAMMKAASLLLIAATFISLTGSSAAVLSAADAVIQSVRNDAGNPVAVEVVGLSPADLQRAVVPTTGVTPLAVFVVDASGQRGEQPLAGTLEVHGASLRFTPQYAFRPGMTYQAQFAPAQAPLAAAPASAPQLQLRFSLPEPPPVEPSRVLQIYPSSDVLPDNHLRFYIHFSAPMNFGEAYSRVHLFAADGQEVKRAFLEIGEELWDGTGTRLTLLFDPGRVKKGLLPREEFGPVLMDGKQYRLVVDAAWRDANNRPLAASFEKRFRAGPPVESAVNARRWQITSPAAHSRDALVVRFDRPLDRALLQRMIGVRGPANALVAGEIAIFDNEQRWEFRPDQSWEPGEYVLVVDQALEDCAGNNLARPFEVDVFDRVDSTAAPDLLQLPFAIKK